MLSLLLQKHDAFGRICVSIKLIVLHETTSLMEHKFEAGKNSLEAELEWAKVLIRFLLVLFAGKLLDYQNRTRVSCCALAKGKKPRRDWLVTRFFSYERPYVVMWLSSLLISSKYKSRWGSLEASKNFRRRKLAKATLSIHNNCWRSSGTGSKNLVDDVAHLVPRLQECLVHHVVLYWDKAVSIR